MSQVSLFASVTVTILMVRKIKNSHVMNEQKPAPKALVHKIYVM